VYHSNRAACLLKLEQFEPAVEDCSAALELDAGYVKALGRRAQAYEKLDKLTEAVADAKAIAELDATSRAAKTNVERLEKLEAEKLEREKEEMLGPCTHAPVCTTGGPGCTHVFVSDLRRRLTPIHTLTPRAGKLKDLGNMFLGNFGMSLDNFKATKDESTGSYNISYEPNGAA